MMAALDVPFKLTIIIIQYGIIFLPILLVMKAQGVKLKERFRFRPVSIWTIFKTVGITLAALPIAYTLNFIVNYILVKMDLFQIQTMDLSGQGALHFLIITFLVAVTPGFVEEFFFRGMMLSAYREQMSPVKAMLLTGLFFGMFHFNLQNLMLPTFLGIIFAWLVYTTDSIIPSMVAHGLFNFIGSVIMTSSDPNAVNPEEAISIIQEQGGQVIIVMLVMSAFAACILAALMYWLKSDYHNIDKDDVLIIKDTNLTVDEILEDGIRVLHDEELKKISFKTLKTLKYKQVKPIKVYGKISLSNKFFMGMVVLLYVSFIVMNYSAMG